MESLIRVAELCDVPEGTSRTIEVGGRSIALFNVAGTVYATADACPDQGYSLGSFGSLSGDVVTCGFHFWEFNVRTGESADGMEERVETFPVVVCDDGVYLAPPPPLPCGQSNCKARA